MGYASIDTIAHHLEETSQQERVGKRVTFKDLITSDGPPSDSDADNNNIESSVKGKNISSLEAAKNSLVKKE